MSDLIPSYTTIYSSSASEYPTMSINPNTNFKEIAKFNRGVDHPYHHCGWDIFPRCHKVRWYRI